jgi:hypothetical protein
LGRLHRSRSSAIETPRFSKIVSTFMRRLRLEKRKVFLYRGLWRGVLLRSLGEVHAMRIAYALFVPCAAVSLALAGCNDKLEQQQHDQAIAAAAASAAAAAAAAQAEKDKTAAVATAATKAQAATELRADVQQHPGKYLQVSNLQDKDKGIINSYRQLTGMTVLNTSKFALNNLSGSVNWLDDNGASTGTTPFTLSGSIPAGATVTFSTAAGTMTSGTLQSKATKQQVTFAPATIVGQ